MWAAVKIAIMTAVLAAVYGVVIYIGFTLFRSGWTG